MTPFSINDSAVLNKSLAKKDLDTLEYEECVFIWIVSTTEIPVILLTLFALSFLIKSRHVASIYVIHLILSDLLQTVMMIFFTTQWGMNSRLWSAYKYTLVVGLFFMACIASERYLLISHPHWYRFHHSVKLSCFISLIIWFVPMTFVKIGHDELFTMDSQSVAFFIPYLIIILCFVGTWRGLSHAISLTSHKRTLVLGSLSLVLLTYTFLILPISITSLYLKFQPNHDQPDHVAHKMYVFSHYLLYLNPLADCLLYLFIRSDVENIMKSLYCCRSSSSSVTTTANIQH